MRFCFLISAFCLLTSVAFALPEPGFDPKDVVRQVRSAHSASGPLESPNRGLDDGEFLIDTSITLVPAPYQQGGPVVAFDGVNFLVVWVDGRRHGGGEIYGARVTPAGVVLDPAGFAISTAASGQGDLAVAFGGTSFLVVWDDRRSGFDSTDLYGARVTQAGVVLDPSGIAISTAVDQQRYPAVAFDGTNFLVVWEDWRNGGFYNSDIYGARVTQAGVVLDPSGIAISTAADYQWYPALAFDGTNYLVVWMGYGVRGARVTQAGSVLDPNGIAISTTGSDPAVAFDGTNFLVAWPDWRSDEDIYGARVTPAGVVLDPAGIAISTAANDQWNQAVAFDGTSFLVVWDDHRNNPDTSDIYGARVTRAGVVLDPNGIAISTAANDQYGPAVSYDGTNFLAVWTDWRSDGDIYGARVTQAGVVLDTTGNLISQATSFQGDPTVAFGGTDFLVVWEDSRSGDSTDIYGARVTQAGGVLDPSGIAISTAANDQPYPAVAFSGTNFLVVWTDERSGVYNSDIYGARVTPAGAVLDPSGIAISTAVDQQTYPAVASDGTNFLVVWEDWRNGGVYNSDIYGTRVTPAGTVLDPAGFIISQAASYQGEPALAFDGTNFIAVWTDYRSGSDVDIYATRVTTAGVVLDPLGIHISAAADDQGYPAVSYDGTNFLAAWTDRRSGSGYDIYGARVTPAGVVLDPSGIPISTATDWQEYPVLAFDGASFLVVWLDWRNGSSDIYGSRVTPGGVVFDSGPVVRQEGIQESPALARGSGSQLFLVYQGWASSVGGKTYNNDRIWGKLNPSPAVAEMTKPEVRMTNGRATIVRGVLVLGAVDSRQNTAYRTELLDISGRKVLDLKPGANDVRAIVPGVYFVREAHQAAGLKPQAVRKIVIAR